MISVSFRDVELSMIYVGNVARIRAPPAVSGTRGIVPRELLSSEQIVL